MLFNDIKFGMIDASNELMEVGNDYYLSSFLEYERYRIKDFIEGKKYFILGRKGTGKTALLKYMQCKFEEDKENMVIPIRFKSDFDEVDRNQVKGSSYNNEEVIEKSHSNIKSYVLAWQVYLIYQIFKNENSQNTEYSVFFENKESKQLWDLLKLIYGENGGNKIVPRIQKGFVSVSIGTKGIDANLAAEINLENEKLNYVYAAKKIIELYENLNFNHTPVYILIDELELSVKTKKEREADIELVRDLIIAVEKLNSLSKAKSFNINCYASIRTDVVENVLSSGYEINKCIEDFGITVEWHQRGGNYLDNPLIKLVEKKIKASENIHHEYESDNVWETYFEEEINNTEVRRYILNLSWYRPRDVIRILSLAQEFCNSNVQKINQEAFDKAMKEYSNRMWRERKEELIMRYSTDDIKAVEKVLTGIEVPFSFNYLDQRIKNLSKMFDCVSKFAANHKLADLLEILYNLGLIGNSGERMVFSFLGYNDFDITKLMIIHTPLRNFFEVNSRAK